MTAPLTGYTSTLPSDVLLDSGVLYAGTTVFGAFAGGLKFDPGFTYRNVDFDGKRSPVKAIDRRMMQVPKLTGTVIQLSTTNVGQIEAGATVATGVTAVTAAGGWTGASSSYTPKRAAGLLAAGDYLSDIRAIWLRGAGTFVQVYFKSALCTKYDITSQDGAEVAIAIEIEARLDFGATGYTNVGDAPYRIEYLTTV
jgi:hypothetical protein